MNTSVSRAIFSFNLWKKVGEYHIVAISAAIPAAAAGESIKSYIDVVIFVAISQAVVVSSFQAEGSSRSKNNHP